MSVNVCFSLKPRTVDTFNTKTSTQGFPGDSVVKNRPGNAGHGLDPWSRKIPHAVEQTSPHNYWACALTPRNRNGWTHALQLLKLTHLERMLCNERRHHNEKPVHRNESVAPTLCS